MKVGTDGVLAGAWAHGGRHILDVGTGTGVIALMMAQRFPQAQVHAVEVDADAARQADDNFRHSPYAARCTVYLTALQDFQPQELYDSIVSNPPYFVDSLRNPDSRRSMARHTDTLSHRDLVSNAWRLLSEDGVLSVILPTTAQDDFLTECSFKGFFLSRLCTVRTTAAKPPTRVMLQLCKRQPAELTRETLTLQDAGGKRSAAYEALTKDFYIY